MEPINTYAVYIKGKNFLVAVENEVKKHVFYAARFVQAKDTTDAVNVTMDILRKELKKDVLNDESDPPLMCLEEIYHAYAIEDNMIVGEKIVPAKGFVWGEEEEKEE